MRMKVTMLAALLLGMAVVQGCASLPPRPVQADSLALAAATGTPLDTALAPVQAAHPGESGFRLVPNGVEAFALRGFSARAAGRSLDVQYYIWHNDLTGRLLARELLRAADRGVRVRVLLDDLDARANNLALAGLDAHPNIEVRLFNPFASRSGSVSKSTEMVTRLSRMNHRMHNKAWIADNRIAIAGGRNIGDEYFGASENVNFLDTDFVMLGPAVQALSASFDSYWNSAAVWPVAVLSPKQVNDATLAKLRVATDDVTGQAAASAWVQALAGTDAVKRIQAGDIEFHWASVWQVLSDDPMKSQLGESPIERSAVLRGFREAMRESKTSITLVSPYFVPGKQGSAGLVDLAKRGRSVSILTNSLAANDVAAVHGGHSRYRDALLDGGVLLWELKPDTGQQTGSSLFGSSGASLHSKSAIFDNDSIFVGSFNLDPRSVSLNCELGILVNDPALAAELAALFARVTSGERAWRVDHDDAGKLRWSDGTQTLHREPGASLPRRATAKLFRWLPFDSQL